MKPKLVFLLVGVCVCVALSALAIIWVVAQNSSGAGDIQSNAGSDLTGTPISSPSELADGTISSLSIIATPSVEALVVYPGADSVSHDKQHPEDWAALSFSTDAPATDVLKFYSDYLFQNNWVLDQSKEIGVGSQSLTKSGAFSETNAYVWRDRANATPWTLALTLSLHETTATPPKRSKVIMVLNRIPSLTNIPTYPRAEQVQYISEPASIYADSGDRHLTYVTDATPEQLIAFYQSVLPQCGWQLEPDSAASANVLHYSWSTKNLNFTTPELLSEANYYLAIKAVAGTGPDGNTNVTNVTIAVNVAQDQLNRNWTP